MPSMIGLDMLACQKGSDNSTAYGIMPFHDLWLLWPLCDFLVFSQSNTIEILGFMPDDCYGLLAVLLHTGRHFVIDGVMT